MRKGLHLVALVIPMVLVASNSYAAVKAGSACSKAGAKSVAGGKSYTCIKSGKKLMWNKGVVVAKPSAAKPSPIPTPNEDPKVSDSSRTSTLISGQNPIDEVSQAIYKIRRGLPRETYSGPNTFLFHFQGETAPEVELKTKRSLLNAIPTYESFGFKLTNGFILVARDIDWIKGELVSRGCKSGSLPDRPGFYVGKTCVDGNGAVTSVHWDIEKFSDGLDGLYFNHVIPHEYFHQLQEQLTAFGNADFPKWFWEGSAQFFTNQAWSSWNTDYSYNQWFEYWWRDLRPDLGAMACKNASIALMSDPGTSGVNGICAYSKGQLVVEFLIYKYGLTKYRELYVQNAIPGWQNFGIVFKRVTGEDLEDFYLKADNFISSRGW